MDSTTHVTNGVHSVTKGVHQNGAHKNGTLQNGTHQNGTSFLNGSPHKKVCYHDSDKTLVTNGTQNGAALKDDEAFLRDLFELLVEKGMRDLKDAKCKVVEFVQPGELKDKLQLELPDEPQSNDKLLDICRQTIKYSVKTGHPRFFNQLFSGQDLYTLGGSWLTETLNTSQYTFEVAPVFTVMEEVMLKKLRSVIGYSDGDGIFCPGGSMSNMYGLNLARYRQFPQVKVAGMQALPPMCLFTSEQSHYSFKKAAAMLGFGLNAVRLVAVDDGGRMCPTALDRAIQEALDEGVHPILVNATGGTTVVGAYDHLPSIADVCERHGIWMHVDACWGGGAMFSKTHRHLLEGIERSDSVAWNPHKMMGAPLQCCAFLTRHKDLLQPCHCANAEYLFQQDKFYDMSYDTGDKSVQCGRKVDVFKLWLLWQAHGSTGLERRIDHVFAMATHLRDRVERTEGFRLVYDKPECTNVCFWYIPPSLRGQEETSDWWKRLGKVAPVIKERMVRNGSMLIGYNPLGSRVNFFRMVVCNAGVSAQDMDFVVDEIDRLGCDL